MSNNVSHLFLDAATAVMLPNVTNETSEIDNSTENGAKNGLGDEVHSNHSSGHTGEYVTIVVAVLCALIAILVIVIIVLMMPWIRHWTRRVIPISKKKLAGRLRTIDGWLITKPALSHEDCCEKHGIDTNSSRNNDHNVVRNEHVFPQDFDDIQSVTASDDGTVYSGGEHDDDSNHVQQCRICIQDLAAGQSVSWSPTNLHCHHVFCTACIREWLVYHSDCPVCRRLYLAIDCSRERIPRDLLQKMLQQRLQRAKQTEFCIQHGLVVVVPAAEASNVDETAGHGDNHTQEMAVLDDDNVNLTSLTMQTTCSDDSSSDQHDVDEERPATNDIVPVIDGDDPELQAPPLEMVANGVADAAGSGNPTLHHDEETAMGGVSST